MYTKFLILNLEFVHKLRETQKGSSDYLTRQSYSSAIIPCSLFLSQDVDN